MPPKRWVLPKPPPAERDSFAARLGVSPLVAQLLLDRGVSDEAAADRFLHPTLDHLHDPELLPDCRLAVERLAAAIEAGEKILVHGDYDVDGVCAAALVTRVLRVLKANVEPFVPHRRVEGYDLRPETVRRVAGEGVRLIVTVDCGTVAFEAAEAARELGVDLIITDHHEPHPDGGLPHAVAVVNPKRADSRYPFHELCGTGVAFKLCTALVRHLGRETDAFKTHYLDLVALATCADCMPLVDENRVFVKLGLDALRKTRKAGLRALMKEADLAPAAVTTRSLGFQIGPRINAIGRIDAAAHALRLMLTSDDHEAGLLAARLEQANADRQQEQERILQEAMRQAERFLDDRVLVLASQRWHPGIIGIVASKITEALCRPTVMVALGDEEDSTARGSCRSIEGFHIFEALHACRGHLIRCGGHAAAAGFDVAPENVEVLREALQAFAAGTLTDDMMQPTVRVDAEVDLDDMDARAARDLELLEPFGHGNHQPVFVSRGARVREQSRIASRIVNGPDHLKLKLQHPRFRFGLDAVFWRAWVRAEECGAQSLIDACYTVELNAFNGTVKPQLNLLDLACVEPAPALPLREETPARVPQLAPAR
jgi:single-stranded-DNA-specific exonuclease